ncbi:MAG: AMP-binding protein [Polyangiaceae bacterium]|nr:AMP-binding protein [Polyangiaceae bacterium]
MRPGPIRLVHETLLDTARRCPEELAVIADDQQYTYGQLLDSAQRMAGTLVDLGIERGDRVAVFAENCWLSVVSLYATLMTGGAFIIVNPQTKSEKLKFMLEDSGARCLVAQDHLGDSFRPILSECAALGVVISTGDPSAAAAKPVVPFADAIAGRPLLDPIPTIPLDVAAIIYTSGTTGTQKGVTLTHQNMVFTMDSVIEYLRLDAAHRFLNVLPLSFSYGLYHVLMSVRLGIAVVLERSFAFPARVFQRMREHEVTVFGAVPTIFSMLLTVHGRSPLTFPSVRRVTNAAAALPESYIPALREVFPNALLFKMYGQTECKRALYLEPELVDSKPGSVGKPIPGTEAYLLSPEGLPVAAGEAGILHIRGPHVMLGYWNRPEETARALRPGRYPGERVLCTHDWFKMDTEGFFYFVARNDDIIKTRGEKVSPTEIEHALVAMPGIREAGVIGVPHDLFGQAIRAYVVLEDGASLAPRAIQLMCREKLENLMVPEQVVIVAALPKTESGKIRRAALPELGFGGG